jgi:hypothetical protein
METIHEPAQETPIVHTCDLCVIGGSSTGVFAAVRAAQLGAKVALVENNGFFGGVATAGLVNIWHSIFDTVGQRQIIGGLTVEVIERLRRRDAAVTYAPSNPSRYAAFNSAELILALDQLVREHAAIRPFLHTRFVRPVAEEGRMTAAIVEDRSGRRAIAARAFIDATGDGDVIARLGLPCTRQDDLQPPTVCAILCGLDEVAARNPGFDLGSAGRASRFPNALEQGFLWHAEAVGLPGARMVAGTRVHGADCSDADQLTTAAIEGRRQARAIRDIVHDHFDGGEAVSLAALSSTIGIRETRHAVCRHRLTEQEVLMGVRFPDAIANGSYRVDVHHSEKAGLTFRYLDGREVHVAPRQPGVEGRWRSAQDEEPTFYQIPYRCLVPLGTQGTSDAQGAENVLVAGRLADADRGAYGAIRVMVNCNQTGEAAGVAACLARQEDKPVAAINTGRLRDTLRDLGAVIV